MIACQKSPWTDAVRTPRPAARWFKGGRHFLAGIVPRGHGAIAVAVLTLSRQISCDRPCDNMNALPHLHHHPPVRHSSMPGLANSAGRRCDPAHAGRNRQLDLGWQTWVVASMMSRISQVNPHPSEAVEARSKAYVSPSRAHNLQNSSRRTFPQKIATTFP